MAVPDPEFEALIARTRRLRTQLAELRVAGSMVEEEVRARIGTGRSKRDLPPAHAQLADEILAVLENPELSTWQAQKLRYEFFANK